MSMTERQAQPNLHPQGNYYPYSLRFWLLVPVAGFAAGLAGGLLMRLLRAVEHACYAYRAGDYLQAVARVAPGRRVAILFAAGCLASLVLWLAKRLPPDSGGDLSAAVWLRMGEFPLPRTTLRAVLSIVTVGMGVSLGREGALKDTAAALASRLSNRVGLEPRERQVLVACAAGAGMAAAYNVPFGGALFAAEILLGSISLPLVLPALAVSFLSTATSWLLLPDVATYQIPTYVLRPLDLVWALLVGPVLGLAAVVWVRSVAWAEGAKPKGARAVVSPIVSFTVLGVAAVWLPDLLGNGKGLVQLAFAEQLGLSLLAVLLVGKLLATLLCLSTGAPGGLFTPTMTYGALLGGLLGRVWTHILPGPPGGEVGIFAIVGSGAVLATTTLGPVSSMVFILELTHHVDSLIVPMLLATTVAMLTSSRFERRSVYSAKVQSQESTSADEQQRMAGRPDARAMAAPEAATGRDGSVMG